MSKQYARITDYGDILVPLNLLEKIVEHGYLVRTEYENNTGEVLKEVHKMTGFKLHSEEEVKSVKAQMILEGNE